MKYVVQASNVTELYEVQKFTNDDGKTFYKKPEFVKRRIDKWKEVLPFECDRLEYNTNHPKFSIGIEGMCFLNSNTINISENEEVNIIEQIFRADKATTYLHSDKVLSITEDKTTNWQAYQDSLIEYRDYVFKKYPAVKEYCELHCVKDEFENIDKIKDIVLNDKYIHTIHIDRNMIPTNNFSKDFYSLLKSWSNYHADIQDDGSVHMQMCK